MATTVTIWLCLLVTVFTAVLGRPQSQYDQQYLLALLNRFQDYPYPDLVDYRRAQTPSIRYDRTWPADRIQVGQVGGVAVDASGNLFVFHRGDHVWQSDTFSFTNEYMKKNDGPIKQKTVLKYSPNGDLLKSFGENTFYMPHGMTVDKDGNLWVTDVALHQVMKIPAGSTTPTLTLGEKFVPGSDDTHFCKPTDVAVAKNGDFFVADGYCNSRIMKFSKNGTLIATFGEQSNLVVPHSLALNEAENVICVANREQRTVECYDAGLNNPATVGSNPSSFSDENVANIYAINVVPSANAMYMVTGPRGSASLYKVHLRNGRPEVVEEEAAPPRGFGLPHDLAVSPDGNYVYTGEIGPNRVLRFNI